MTQTKVELQPEPPNPDNGRRRWSWQIEMPSHHKGSRNSSKLVCVEETPAANGSVYTICSPDWKLTHELPLKTLEDACAWITYMSENLWFGFWTSDYAWHKKAQG